MSTSRKKHKPGVVCICHILPKGRTVYHLGSGCRVGTKRDEAVHFATDDPEGQAMQVRQHLCFGIQQNPDLIGVPISKIKTIFRFVAPRNMTDEDRLAFQRRFGYDPKNQVA